MNHEHRENIRLQLAAAHDARNYHAERILAQLDFAEGLLDLHRLQGRKISGWAKRIEQAWSIVADSLAHGRSDRLKKAVADAEAVLQPIGVAAKKYTVHCVGHAHIDMNWMWSWPETVALTNDTFTTVLRLMDEFPDFTFSQSQASVYDIARQFNPDLFEQIRRRVAEGRWEVSASHWVEGDKNLASGESIARHLLYTRNFMQDQLGLSPADVQIDWSPDTFGHAATIPAIDSRGGVKFYYCCRPGYADRSAQPLFWWQAPDGSRVLVNLETRWYNNAVGPQFGKALLDFARVTNLHDFLALYGVGDHGGGPTRRDLLRVRDIHSWPIFPAFVFSTAARYFQRIERAAGAASGDKKLPVRTGELNFEFTGCYTSQSLIKKVNRYGENYCIEAEQAAALAWAVLDQPYPEEKLRDSWIPVLFNHFHDILPGSGVRATRDYAHGTFQQVAATTGMIRTHALRALAAAADTSFAPPSDRPAKLPSFADTAFGAGVGRDTHFGSLSLAGRAPDGPRPFVVFNPNAWPRQEIIRATVWDAGAADPVAWQKQTSFRIRRPDGTVLPAQRISGGHYWGHNYVDLAVPVAVPPMGYAAFIIEEGHAPAHAPDASPTNAVCHAGTRGGERQPMGKLALENEFLYVEFDRLTGGISRFVDKTSNRDFATPGNPLAVLEYAIERPRGMSSWIIADHQRIAPVELNALIESHQGPHLAAVTAKGKIEDSQIELEFTLPAGQRRLDITIRADWLQRGGENIGTPSLRIRFPLPFTDARARYEIPFGAIDRPQNSGEEVPALRWADVTGKLASQPGRRAAAAGFTLLNDCKHGHSLDGSTLRLTLIRSSYRPDPLPEIGPHEIRLAIIPHAAPAAPADLTRSAAAFNHPLQLIPTDIHPGRLPSKCSAINVANPDVIITSVRKARQHDALILHLQETAGKSAAATIEINETLLGRPLQAVEVDFLERETTNNAAKIRKNTLTVPLTAFGLAAVKVTLARK